MYVMRPAVPADVDGVTRVIDKRCVHHLIQGKEQVRNDGDRVRRLLTHPGPASEQVWVFTDESAVGLALDESVVRAPLSGMEELPVVGFLILTDQLAERPLWPRTECAEPSLSLECFYTYPHPELRFTGRLMHWWVLDHVARRYWQADWVRCAVPHTRLMRYLRDGFGWEYVRSATGAAGAVVHLMQRRPQIQDHLARLITTGQPATSAPGGRGNGPADPPPCDSVLEPS